MASTPILRRAVRRTRPDSQRFFTVMLVLSHRTFRWSVARRTVLWSVAIGLGIWLVAMSGSAYGFWATKKLMSFSTLQQETQEQQRQLRDSQEQALALEQEIQSLRGQMDDLMKHLDPKAGPTLQPVPDRPKEGQGSAEKMSLLKRDLDEAMTQAKLIRARMEPVLEQWMRTPSIFPTAGYLSSGFGLRVSPFSRGNNEGDGLLGYHAGLDLTNKEGTPIQATAGGKVVSAGYQPKYGWTVVIRHTAELETLYAHLSRMDVVEGQSVVRGDIIGAMGRSGNATGVHLHYEVRRNGQPVNPTPYLRLQRQFLSTKDRSFFRG